MIYEEDLNLQLDIVMVQKFGKLSTSPPIEIEDLPKVEKQLLTLRDALNLKGKVEIC